MDNSGKNHTGMNVCPYSEARDFEMISSWYQERNLPAVPKSFLPPVGFIVPGVACAHLYQTDGGVALLENFISNPNTSRAQRVEALEVITKELLKAARNGGYRLAIAPSTHPTISAGCEKQGFQYLGRCSMFSKEVK